MRVAGLGRIEQLRDDKPNHFGRRSDGQMGCPLLVSWRRVPSGHDVGARLC